MTTVTDVLTAARAEALFASDLSIHHLPTAAQISAAIRNAVRAHGGTRGCAGEVAAAYGDYPESAAARMRWALGIVQRTYGARPGSGPCWVHLRRRSPTRRSPVSDGCTPATRAAMSSASTVAASHHGVSRAGHAAVR
jgi:hypothetical protein